VVTSALVSAANNNNKDKIVVDAIMGGAIATAAEFLNYLTWTDVSEILLLSLCSFWGRIVWSVSLFIFLVNL
jgi:hypothetical protein